MKKLLTTLVFILCGCRSTSILKPSNYTQAMSTVTDNSDSMYCSPLLGLVGGVCILAGMVMLVVTRGIMGWRPVIGGILFIVINYAMSLYGGWFFLPVAICTGAISLAWTGKVIYKIINDDEIKLKELKL
tara:strand:- start:251 stop:640 length:390 start_codon:yes stop_codon:yes gene_type:complete